MKDGSGKKILHHGTMLLDVELTALKNYLSPHKLKLESKGVQSVISRVTNLKDLDNSISHEKWVKELKEAYS
jgi:lipoate-protein ligase A